MTTSGRPTLTLTCHCKAIQIVFPTPEKPLNKCECSICHRLGGLWAYFKPADVQIGGSGSTVAYVWNQRLIEFHRCSGCGCVTHWEPVDKTLQTQRYGINCRMLPKEDLEKLETRVYGADLVEAW